jgi:hypothetical protein
MRTRGFGIKFLFVILAASVLLGASGCGKKSSEAARRSSSSVQAASVVPLAARSLSPLPARALSAQLQALRAELMRETAVARGLEWKSEVGMTELSGWEYGTRSKELAEVLGGDDFKALSSLAVAGGILPEGTDLATLAVSFTAASSGATYSPLDRQVLLREAERQQTSAQSEAENFKDRSLLTHEFVHALQDQHFDLLKLLLARPYNFDRTEAAFALVEGDAMNVQRRRESGDAWARRSLEEIARQEDERFGEYRRTLGAFFPPLLVETFIFRYRDGARFVEAMRRSRPAVASDELFRRPPASSEQVLHVEKYLSNESPREIVLNEEGFVARGWRMSAETPLGEIGVRGLLLAGNSRAEAVRAAAGWGGDRAFVFERQERAPLFVWKTAWDKREDAQEFFRAYNSLQRRTATQANLPLEDEGDASAVWRQNNLLTLVRLEGDTVLVVRCAEADLDSVLELVE